ncbi:MAG: HemK2/MTQ2 family protein methyltransferase [Candidatus Thermoplasmatota archaeon]
MSREVYPPSEDTDLLLSVLARESLAGTRACEVGSGSGVVSRAMLDAGAMVVAVDINPEAAAATRMLGVPVLRGDLLSALRRASFDLIVFNAPYLPSSDEERLPSEIDHAFHGGDEGVEVSERFVRDLPRVLAPGGRAFLVVSSRANLDRLARAVAAAGLRHESVASARFFFEEIFVWRLAGR